MPQAGQRGWSLLHQIIIAILRVVFRRGSSRKNGMNFGVLLWEVAPPGIRKLEGRVLIQKHEIDSLRNRSLNVHGRGACLRVMVRGRDHRVAVAEIVIERYLKLKTGTVAKVTEQLFL